MPVISNNWVHMMKDAAHTYFFSRSDVDLWFIARTPGKGWWVNRASPRPNFNLLNPNSEDGYWPDLDKAKEAVAAARRGG
jgi:hypothetical protein